MNFTELSQKRYSVRSYKGVSVEDENLIKILETGQIFLWDIHRIRRHHKRKSLNEIVH